MPCIQPIPVSDPLQQGPLLLFLCITELELRARELLGLGGMVGGLGVTVILHVNTSKVVAHLIHKLVQYNTAFAESNQNNWERREAGTVLPSRDHTSVPYLHTLQGACQ